MKGMKKLLSILMVLTLVMSLGATALAATITVDPLDKDTVEHTYEVYQIFAGTQDPAYSEGDGDDAPLGDVVWGENIDGDAFLKALQADPDIGSHYTTDKSGNPITDAKGVAKALGEYQGDAEKFAEIAAKHLTGTPKTVKSTDTAGVTVDNGYYLIQDVTPGTTLEDGSARNKTMLQVTRDVQITPKYDIPSSEKKVLDINDTDTSKVKPTAGDTNDLAWEDTADHDIGDVVYFKLTGTLPTDLATYDPYELTFHDKEGPGLIFDSIVGVYYQAPGPDDLTVIDATYYTVTQNPSDTDSFDISFSDVTDIPDVVGGGKIVVVYGSKLDGAGVVIGSKGNPNEMYMEYSNDSENGGKGKTPVDTVIVFTYELDTNKIDGDKEPLDGAGFTLLKEYKQPDDNASHDLDPEYTYENVQNATAGSWLVEKDASGNIVKYWKVVGVIKDADAGTDFDFKGIDDGTYRLVETEVPAGYNKADDIEFTVKATHTSDPGELKLETLTANGATVDPDKPITVDMTADASSGAVGTDVMNQEGPVLPETGGIGTTIFYIAGAVLVAGAVILLVTKKRVSGMEK